MVEADREQWATRIGFILAAVGSAVGLGNIWRFPFQVGQEGGAAFLFVYLVLILLIGLPAMLVEFVIGRRSERNPINAFTRLGHGSWTFAGIIAVIGGFVILSFYTVVGGWVGRYTFVSLTGSYFDDPEAYFVAVSAGGDALLFQFAFLLVTAGIVALGIQRGIELAVKALVPALVLLMVMLILYAATLDGAVDGYAWYLEPDFGVMIEEWRSIVPAALGQAFFTLSLGMGIMITYASYIAEDRNLGYDGGWIVGLDTIIAVAAGLMIFPVLFHVGISPGSGGAGEMFTGVGAALADVPAGRIVGFLLFGAILVAAISSAISLLEVMVSFVIDHFAIDRLWATIIVAGSIFVVGIPTALDINTLELYDRTTAELVLPTGVLLLVLFVGWVYEDAIDEVSKGVEHTWLPNAWLWHVRSVLMVVIAVVLAVSFWEFFIDLPDLVDGLRWT